MQTETKNVTPRPGPNHYPLDCKTSALPLSYLNLTSQVAWNFPSTTLLQQIIHKNWIFCHKFEDVILMYM